MSDSLDPNAKRKRLQSALVVVGTVGIFALVGASLFFFEDTPKRREKPTTVAITAPGNIEDRDAWRAAATARERNTESLLTDLKTQLKNQDEANRKLAKEVSDLRTRGTGSSSTSSAANASVLDKPLPPVAIPTTSPTSGAGQRVLTPPPSTLNTPLSAPGSVDTPPRREVELVSFSPTKSPSPDGANGVGAGKAGGNPELMGFPTDEKAKKYVTAGGEGGYEFIPAGSFVRATLLNGVDAPTGGQAQSNPLPMAFHVIDVANLPNRNRLDVTNCRVIASAWGDLSAERTIARLESLTCVFDGETVEMEIKGWAIGEDGKAGLRGRLVTKQGQLLANALLAGGLSGIGRAVQQSATITSTGGSGVTQTFDTNRIENAAIGGGVGSAGQALAAYYMKAADKLFPVIETDGGRVVELLFTKGASYRGRALSKSNYAGLVRRASPRGNEDVD